MEHGVGGSSHLSPSSETFYDLNTHTVYTPQPTYALPHALHPPPHPPHHHPHHHHHPHQHPPPPARPVPLSTTTTATTAPGNQWSAAASLSSASQTGEVYYRYHDDGELAPRPLLQSGGRKKVEEEEDKGFRKVGMKGEMCGGGGGGGGVGGGGCGEGEEDEEEDEEEEPSGPGGESRQKQARSTPLSGECLEDDDDKDEESSKDGDRMGDNSSNKHSQVEATLTWLTANYERAEGVCLPRCVLYTHYVDFCKKHDFTPAGPATFGKIIRQKFPKLTTRRLGTRGQSKYHYYGIGIKETSVYYHSVYSGRGLTRFSGVKVKTEGSNRKYSLSSKTGTLLPEFPHVHHFILPDSLSSEKMQTFLMMYRTHCQRILDTIISANFDEVQNLLLHFWQGMPSHLTDILSADILCDIVSLCDSILYKVLADVLLPSCVQDMPDNLGTEIKVFARKLPEWLWSALDNVVPDCLRHKKMEASRVFARSVSRQLSFVHLAQCVRSTLNNQEEVTQMSADLSQVDFRQILCQAFYTQPASAQSHCDLVMENFIEFHGLLQKQCPVESYTEWIDSMIDSCVLQPCKDKGEGFRDSAAEFLMQWSLVASLLKKDLTLLNSKSFGSLHLLHMMLDEYVYLVMETQRDQSRDHHLQQQVQRHMKNAETIKTQAKVRAGTHKIAAMSPKTKKRKQAEEHTDSTEEMEVTQDIKVADNAITGQEEACLVNSSPASSSSYHTPHTATAFTRPPPSTPRDPLYSQSEDNERLAAHCYPPLPMSPANKPLTSVNGVTNYDRPTYFSQFGPLNTYSDYVSHNASAMTSSRVPTHVTDPHTYGQTFPSVSFSTGGGTLPGSYHHWGDGRTPAVLADPYSQYSAHGVSSAYDSYKNAALLRGPVYGQETALGLNAAARGYFAARASDTYQGSALAVAPAYGGNFMEIAPNGAQYPRPEPLPTYQEDLYASGMASTLPAAFHKHYLTSSFR